jgi:outer membrane protein assembly factor BamB
MVIRRLRLLIPALCILSVAFSQTKELGMFRGNPLHMQTFTSTDQIVFDTRDWKSDAGSPIRSTPLVAGNMVYFGTTGGVFFAMDKTTGAIKWKRNNGFPINSSAAFEKGKVFFSDNQQAVIALDAASGKLIWTFNMGRALEYPWRFDYYYSSPTVYNGKLVIGGDDGNLYVLNTDNGRLLWKFDAKAAIRSSPAIYNNHVLFGDVNSHFYCLDLPTGKETWRFNTVGDTLKNEEWGFDRKAILSSPVVLDDKIIFGCRAGFLYCLRATDGKLVWRMDHKISWVISTVAVKDSIVVTGTSDGRFVQAINLETGKEIWKFRTAQVEWSSPLIVNEIVYAADFDGQLYCLDLRTGKRISEVWTGDKIMSSPVYDNEHVYIGSDDGNLYALKGRSRTVPATNGSREFVFYDPAARNYFQSGTEGRIKDYLAGNGFRAIGADTIADVLIKNSKGSVIVFASNYFPDALIQPADNCVLRKYLDAGGRVVMLGVNPLAYKLDEKTKQPVGFNVAFADSVLGLYYGPNDTRAFGGVFTSFPTTEGKLIGLPAYWTSMLFIKPEQVDVVLGKNENGLASTFVKKYKNGGAFIQLILHPRAPVNLDAIIKAAEQEY